jgi:hypothetical protein
MSATENKAIWEEKDILEDLGQEILRASTEDVVNRTRLLENEIKVRSIRISAMSKEFSLYLGQWQIGNIFWISNFLIIQLALRCCTSCR